MTKIISLLLILSFIFTGSAYPAYNTLRVPIVYERKSLDSTLENLVKEAAGQCL